MLAEILYFGAEYKHIRVRWASLQTSCCQVKQVGGAGFWTTWFPEIFLCLLVYLSRCGMRGNAPCLAF